MSTMLQFDPKTGLLTGPAGTLSIPATDLVAPRFLMLVEGQCLQQDITRLAKKHGLCRQRYYQLLDAFKQRGLPALQPAKTGPKSNYRRTDQAVRQVLRYRFLDPDASAEVIAQQLRQTHFPISLRSVQRVLADYGLQKKTLPPQPQEPASAAAHPTRPPAGAPPTQRRPQHRTSGPPNAGR